MWKGERKGLQEPRKGKPREEEASYLFAFRTWMVSLVQSEDEEPEPPLALDPPAPTPLLPLATSAEHSTRKAPGGGRGGGSRVWPLPLSPPTTDR